MGRKIIYSIMRTLNTKEKMQSLRIDGSPLGLLGLLLQFNQACGHVLDTLLQRDELDSELLGGFGVVDLVDLGAWLGVVGNGDLVDVTRELTAEDTADVLVQERARGDEVAVALGVLEGA